MHLLVKRVRGSGKYETNLTLQRQLTRLIEWIQ